MNEGGIICLNSGGGRLQGFRRFTIHVRPKLFESDDIRLTRAHSFLPIKSSTLNLVELAFFTNKMQSTNILDFTMIDFNLGQIKKSACDQCFVGFTLRIYSLIFHSKNTSRLFRSFSLFIQYKKICT
jgi:hypothetical protein